MRWNRHLVLFETSLFVECRIWRFIVNDSCVKWDTIQLCSLSMLFMLSQVYVFVGMSEVCAWTAYAWKVYHRREVLGFDLVLDISGRLKKSRLRVVVQEQEQGLRLAV